MSPRAPGERATAPDPASKRAPDPASERAPDPASERAPDPASEEAPDPATDDRRKTLIGAALVVAAVIALALAYRFTRLGELVTPSRLAAHAASLRGSSLAPLAVPVAFCVLCALMVPVNALVVTTGLVFGPLLGAAYALLGMLTSALMSFGLGKAVGERPFERLRDPRVGKLRERLSRHGVAAVLACRFVPVAPFGLVNLFAGAVGVRLRDFAIGTFVGTLPGAVIFAGFGSQIGKLLEARSRGEIVGLVAGAIGLVALVAFVGLSARRLFGGARGDA